MSRHKIHIRLIARSASNKFQYLELFVGVYLDRGSQERAGAKWTGLMKVVVDQLGNTLYVSVGLVDEFQK